MKRKGSIVVAVAMAAFAACMLAGCGASLDREVTVQNMTLKVPGAWLESPANGNSETSGTVVFTEDNDDLDEDETGNSLAITYRSLAGKPAAAAQPGETEVVVEQEGADQVAPEQESAEGEAAAPEQDAEPVIPSAEPKADKVEARTAAEAIAAKQADLEKKYGITAWSIDKEKTKVMDGAQVTVYEYSFVKDIEGQKRKYESKTAYIVTTDTIFEIAAVGDKADINGVVDSIEF